jgi:hypothetical protein
VLVNASGVLAALSADRKSASVVVTKGDVLMIEFSNWQGEKGFFAGIA